MTPNEYNDIINMVLNHSAAMGRPRDKRFSDVVSDKGESLILLFYGKLSSSLRRMPIVKTNSV